MPFTQSQFAVLRISTEWCCSPAFLRAAVALLFIGALPLVAKAQSSVAPTCPSGYVLSGNKCVKAGTPAPSCPSGYAFKNGQCVKGSGSSSFGGSFTGGPVPIYIDSSAESGPWVFVSREVFGVNSASELDGASYCAVSDSASARAANEYFDSEGMSAKHIEVGSHRKALEQYQNGKCDVLVVEKRVASRTLNILKPEGSHLVLPEKFGKEDKTAKPPVQTTKPAPAPEPAPAPAPTTPLTPPSPPQTDLAYPLQAELKRLGCLSGNITGNWDASSRAALARFSKQRKKEFGTEPTQAALNETRKTPTNWCYATQAAPKPQPQQQKRPRCSGIRYAFTRGNTCACAGGRVFTGRSCVYPRR